MEVHCDKGVANHIGPEQCVHVRESMDEVEFSRKKGKNLLRMVKYLSPTPQVAASEGE